MDETTDDELGRLLARYARTGVLPPDLDVAGWVLALARSILAQPADPDTSAGRELRELLRKRGV